MCRHRGPGTMMDSICVNPSCCNVDTFTGDVCPYCGDVMLVDVDLFMRAMNDDEHFAQFVQYVDNNVIVNDTRHARIAHHLI
jgi:hypothetical protein